MPSIHVDFYILDSNEPNARFITACYLIEEAYAKGRKVYIHCDTQQEAELLDELLWTFKDNSFIAHNLLGEGPLPPPPVQIGHTNQPRGFDEVLINLARAIPTFHSRFKAIIEIVPESEQEKELSRIHYKEYRALGYQLNTHQYSVLNVPA